MSGGSLGYFFCEVEQHAGDFKDKELDNLLKDLADLFHAREWYLSGDTGEGDWNEARDSFKAKWFSAGGRAERIEKYLAEITGEGRGMFGLGTYCQECEHWTKEPGTVAYGKCKFTSGCLTHRSETACPKFERRANK